MQHAMHVMFTPAVFQVGCIFYNSRYIAWREGLRISGKSQTSQNLPQNCQIGLIQTKFSEFGTSLKFSLFLLFSRNFEDIPLFCIDLNTLSKKEICN